MNLIQNNTMFLMFTGDYTRTQSAYDNKNKPRHTLHIPTTHIKVYQRRVSKTQNRLNQTVVCLPLFLGHVSVVDILSYDSQRPQTCVISQCQHQALLSGLPEACCIIFPVNERKINTNMNTRSVPPDTITNMCVYANEPSTFFE